MSREPVTFSMSKPMTISAITASSCLGYGMAALADGLHNARTGLAPCDFLETGLQTFTGSVTGVDEVVLPADLSEHDCRNNRLAELTLAQDGFAETALEAIAHYGASRVGLFLGSSTSGLLQTEIAYRHRDESGALPAALDYAHTHNMFSLGGYVAARFGLTGPQSVTSVACASSAKVFATAARAIDAGLVDAAVVGGVDSLCLTTLYGFGSLELLSTDICRPYDQARNGISIAEAGAFALLEKPDSLRAASGQHAQLAGFGESSDAYHMSTPHPEGAGAARAMQEALNRAGLTCNQIDYINLHGTATPSNDASEDAAVHTLFGDQTPVSSTKGAHGHTLGAAGALEAAICVIALRDGLMPAGLNVEQLDPTLKCQFLTRPQPAPLRAVMSNSFGFGGANASLILTGASH
ncbi:MAG: beta-ketoacyl-[acyl-carrier-protein] synthase family protein [Burkholderiaceae bacterium]